MASPGLGRLLNQLQADDWLSPLIDASFEEDTEPEGWDGRKKRVASPSSAGSSCERDIQLHLLGHQTGVAAKNRRRMDNGIQVHDRWTARFARLGGGRLLVSADEFLTADEPGEPGGFRGRPDLVVLREGPAGQLHAGEIKSMNEWRFKGLAAQDADFGKMAKLMWDAERAYTRQLLQYWAKLREQLANLPYAQGHSLSDDAFFLFENTNNQDYRVIWIKALDGLVDDAFRLPRLATEATRAGELIEPPFKRQSSICKKCYRKRVCFALQDGDEDEWQNVRTGLETLARPGAAVE